MNPGENGAGQSNIGKLESFLGKEWARSRLAQYETFREQRSPTDIWSHRHPGTSPIVPLLFQYHHPDYPGRQSTPHGFWYGDPLGNLRQIADAIYSFEDYWSAIPEKLIADHLRHKLSTGDELNSFMLELMVALDFRQKYEEHDAHLLFLDPATAREGPDIMLRKGSDEIDICCRTISPLPAVNTSFDIFQYLFGCFYRLVRDSRRSYRLVLNVKRELGVADVDSLLERLAATIGSGQEGLKDKRGSLYDAEIMRLDVPIEGLSAGEISGLLARDRGDLLVEIGGGNPGGEKKATRVAVCSVSGGQYRPFEDWIVDAVRKMAREPSSGNRRILVVHLHRYVGWGDYLGNTSHRLALRQALSDVLAEYPDIEYVHVSSNRQEYVMLPSDAQRVDTKDLEVANRSFAGKPEPTIHVRKDSFSMYPEDEEEKG